MEVLPKLVLSSNYEFLINIISVLDSHFPNVYSSLTLNMMKATIKRTRDMI